MNKNIDEKMIAAIRYAGLTSIKAAGGGHVGMTISAAPITYTLFTKFININKDDGKWISRDRFVLSGGHGSMSFYPILYLAGLLSKQEMLNFKMKNSKTPGHPEFEKHIDNFVDASTGPLGQGFAMGVGMAISEKIAREKFPKSPNLINNYTYVLCGDGDLQEGISYETMAVAGKLKLNKLIVLHDSNDYQLDSSVSTVSVENLKKRCQSNEWNYIKTSNNPKHIEKAIKNAQKSDKPTFIEVKTIIAEGLTNEAKNIGHHGIINDKDLENFNKKFDVDFTSLDFDQEIFDFFYESVTYRGLVNFNHWENYVKTEADKTEVEMLNKWKNNDLNYEEYFSNIEIKEKNQATRVYLKNFISNMDSEITNALSICADLSSSTNIKVGNELIQDGGNAIYVGIREFAMGAIINGICLYGLFRTIGGTFLVFADYIKSAIRLGALMKLPAIYAFTHDSYQVGGDGPTHQPFDQLPMLRSMAEVEVHRPSNEEELRDALIESYESKDITNILILSRQNITSNVLTNKEIKNIKKGAYEIYANGIKDVVIAASGSEVELAISVAKELDNVSVVSVPNLDKTVRNLNKLKELFKSNKVLVTIEASSDYKWLALHQQDQKNIHIGAYEFGASMDGEQLYREKGFSKELILEKINKVK